MTDKDNALTRYNKKRPPISFRAQSATTHALLIRLAREEGISLNRLCGQLIEEALSVRLDRSNN